MIGQNPYSYDDFRFNLYGIYPAVPRGYLNKPPTLLRIMQSMALTKGDEIPKIKNLPAYVRDMIFDFDYPLSTKVNKEHFECMILKHFIERRIGSETMLSFKLKLETKLDEIMPRYNIMFDAFDNWSLFDGKKITETSVDNRQVGTTTSSTDSSSQSSSSSEDNRFSDTPQNEIQSIKDGNYVSKYSFIQGSNESSGSGESESESSVSDINNGSKTILEDVDSKIETYTKFLENRNTIMGLIYKDLEPLFYQLA